MLNKSGLMKKIYVLTVLITALIFSCEQKTSEESTKTYVGKEIKLDFNEVRDIPDLAWIEVDSVRFTHYQDFTQQYKDSLSIAASKTKYYKGGNEILEPNNPYSIAISLGNFIDLVSTHTNEETARVKIDQRFLMMTHGIIILHNAKGRDVQVTVPKDYPVAISVMESE